MTPTTGPSDDTPASVSAKPAKAPKKSRYAPRTTARLAAVQALYEIEVSGANVNEVVPDMVGRGFANLLEDSSVKVARPDAKLFERLVLGSFEDRGILDQLIVDSLQQPGHFERIEVILRAILRLGAYELLAMSDVPAKVVISEYMDIGDAFFGGKELSLINAVLDRIAHNIREGDFETEGRAPKGGEG